MGTAARLSGFVAALALVFAVAWWVGAAPSGGRSGPRAGTAAPAMEHAHEPSAAGVESAGLSAAAAGDPLVPQSAEFTVAPRDGA